MTPEQTPEQADLRRRIRQATPIETWEPLSYDEHVEWLAHMEELGDEIADLRSQISWAESELARRHTLAKAADDVVKLEAALRRLSTPHRRPESTHREWKQERPELRLVSPSRERHP